MCKFVLIGAMYYKQEVFSDGSLFGQAVILSFGSLVISIPILLKFQRNGVIDHVSKEERVAKQLDFSGKSK